MTFYNFLSKPVIEQYGHANRAEDEKENNSN